VRYNFGGSAGCAGGTGVGADCGGAGVGVGDVFELIMILSREQVNGNSEIFAECSAAMVATTGAQSELGPSLSAVEKHALARRLLRMPTSLKCWAR
jgi:hypothetical protein